MLEWLTGSSRDVEAHHFRPGTCGPVSGNIHQAYETADDGLSYIEEPEPPATPAPLFAIRAFKTAIWGTPHPDQRAANRDREQVAQNIVAENNALQPEPDEDRKTGDRELPSKTPAAIVTVDPLASPSKGILLTPGTGTTRRKTVTFGNLIANSDVPAEILPTHDTKKGLHAEPTLKEGVREASSGTQRRHSTLTKTLIELSKQKPEKSAELPASSECDPWRKYEPNIGFRGEGQDVAGDTTIDLSQPRSRSGQHWKTEYEQYHKRSNREMKKIILYGQNVKSYAVKKDSEATKLGEKLKKELTKCVAMEEKVSKLAAQLNSVRAQGPTTKSEQTALVSELAQQTALAIQYKQRADHYKDALQKAKFTEVMGMGPSQRHVTEEAANDSHESTHLPENIGQSSDVDLLLTQLESLRNTAKAAEDQAARFEAENALLKRSLARVKEEMMSYESRRQAREERMKSREAKMKAERTACEVRLAKLTVEHQKLLLASRHVPVQTDMSQEVHNQGEQRSTEDMIEEGNLQDNNSVRDPDLNSQSSVSPRKARPAKSTIDIWTFSSPKDVSNDLLPKEPTELPPSSVRHDIRRTLKEIDQNLVPENHEAGSNPKAPRTTALVPSEQLAQTETTLPGAKRVADYESGLDPPRPCNSSKPAELQHSQGGTKPDTRSSQVTTIGGSASLMSKMGRRTNTMTSARGGSTLPAERAAAAKARLAMRSAEKRRLQERKK